ncbi:MAG: FtsQ-type POTRA domain-containing protein [Candidatus Omnitrophica bacterium]|nr:FtsQ-type POTRA domain-containing protein [Candidatus Omnitrophota bacterium]
MAKKSSVKISRIAVIRAIVFLFIAFVLFSAYVNALDFLTTSPLFAVKDVRIERSIQFISPAVLTGIKGTNIFEVDIDQLGRRIRRRYPYIAQLRVVRQLPNRILILAKKRDPLMQIYYRNKFLLLDTEGVALYYTLEPARLPLVYGVPVDNWLFLGGTVQGPQLSKVIEVLNVFKRSPYLRQWRIHTVQAGNLAKIDLLVGRDLHVILDQDNTEEEIAQLQMLAASHKIDLNKVKYIDLRFNEPVIADHTQAKG